MADVLAAPLAARGRPTLVRQIDPRYRIVAASLFAIVTVALNSIPALCAALGIAFALLLSARLPAIATLKRMAAMDTFIIFLLAMLPFTVPITGPGDIMFTLWGFDASWRGLWQAIEIALTANAVILCLMALVGTLEPVVLGHALHSLRAPERLVHLLMFTLRYISVLHGEYLRMRAAMKARGFKARNSIHTLRSFGYLVGMMLVRAIERSERIMGAMKCRGFTGRFPVLEQFRPGVIDTRFAILFALILVLLILIEVAYAAV